MRGFVFAALACALAFALGCDAPSTVTGCSPRDGLHPHCGFQNPEDLLALDGGWLLVSQGLREDTPGSLLAFHPERGERRELWPDAAARAAAQKGVREDPSNRSARVGNGDAADAECARAPNALFFNPHGIARSADGAQVFVINHGGGEAVEFFEIAQREPPVLRWRGCTLAPARFDALLNDLAAHPDGGFVATKMMSASPLKGALSLLLGRESGELLRWSPAAKAAATADDHAVHHNAPASGARWRAVPNSAGVGPNGVAVSADGARFFFSEWTGRRLTALDADGGARKSVALDFAPDNLTWQDQNTLLLAGQSATLLEAFGCVAAGAETNAGACGIGSRVVSVNARTLTVTTLLAHDPPTVLGAASVALSLNTQIWIGTFSGDRLVSMVR